MWVVYRKSDKQVVGTSVDAGVEQSKEEALKGVVDGLVGRPARSEFEAVEVKDNAKFPRLLRAVSEGRAQVKELSGGKLDVADDIPEAVTIRITTNAQQFHPVDNVPLIPGDGTSFVVVSLEKILEEQGTPLTRVTKDNEVIWLRTDHGTLREDKDGSPQEIRSVKLAGGTAKFRLYSENAKRLATVQMLSTNPALRLGGVRVEFI